jgi:hypothetical protein
VKNNWTIEFNLPSEIKGIIGLTGISDMLGPHGFNFINLIRKPKIKKILNRI